MADRRSGHVRALSKFIGDHVRSGAEMLDGVAYLPSFAVLESESGSNFLAVDSDTAGEIMAALSAPRALPPAAKMAEFLVRSDDESAAAPSCDQAL